MTGKKTTYFHSTALGLRVIDAFPASILHVTCLLHGSQIDSSSVVLPLPLGAKSPVTVPVGISMLALSRISLSPRRAQRLRKPVMRIASLDALLPCARESCP